MAVVSMKQLLEAGVHFGHQTRRWNPKMAEYIFTERNGIYIIDLQKTVKKLDEAYNFVRDLSTEGKTVLFVGTKKQAQESVKEEAERAGAYYVNARWLGGMLTNFTTIKRRIARLKQLRAMEADGTFDLLPKKEVIKLNLEIEKLEKFMGGIKDMPGVPGCLFIVDPRKEKIAVSEADAVPLLHDMDIVGYAIVPLYHGNSLGIGHHPYIRPRLTDKFHQGRVVRLHVVDHKIVYLPVSEFPADVVHIFGSKTGLGSIYQGHFLVDYQI